MDYSVNIHDFVDGSLDRQAEEHLFLALASNQGLRNELKEYIEFEKAAKADTAAFMPPHDSTAAIFSRLDIAGPAIGASIGAGVRASAISAFFSKFKYSFLANTITALVTAASILFFVNQDNGDMAANEAETVNNYAKVLASPALSYSNFSDGPTSNQSSIPTVSSAENEVQPKIVYKTVYKYIPAPEKKDEEPEGINKKPEETETRQETPKLILAKTDISNDVNSLLTYDNLRNKYYRDLSSAQIPEIDEMIQFDNHKPLLDLSDISIEMHENEFLGSYPGVYPDSKRTSQNIFENNSLSILYKCCDQVSLGIDLRNEFYFLKYNDFDEDGIEYVNTHNTNYFAYGGFVRFSPDFFDSDYIKPFGQLYIGKNKIGLIGRFMAGAELLPDNPVSFVVGIEGSSFVYEHDKYYFAPGRTEMARNSTENLTFRYGVKINL